MPMTVLIVDDEAGILETLQILLRNEGFEPHVAAGGKAGLEQIEALSPDIVLSDVRMPGVSGIELQRKLKAVNNPMPVIVMTAFGSIQDAVLAMKEGALDFLAKPVDPDHLLLMVERAAAQRRLVGQLLTSLLPVLDTFDLVEQALGRPIHLPKIA